MKLAYVTSLAAKQEESEETKMVRELDQLQLHLEQLTRQEKKLLELHQAPSL